MPGSTYGVLVIGAGWVSTQHIAAYAGNPHTSVVAICSRRPEQARQRAQEAGLAGVAIFDDLDQALAPSRRRSRVDLLAAARPLPARAGRGREQANT